MMSRIFCICLVVVAANAAVWMGKLPAKPKELAHKEGCYVKEINDVIPFSESVSPVGYCYRIDCSPELMHYSSCGAVATDDPKCHVTDLDLSRPYPQCCPDIKCDVENNII